MKPIDMLIGSIVIVAALLLLRPLLPGQHLMLQAAPLIEIAQAPARLGKRITLWIERQADLQRQLAQSQQQLQTLSMLHGELAHLRQENHALQQLLSIDQPQPYQWRAAHTVALSTDSTHRHLLLKVNGASLDDVVVSEHGLVGLVTAISRQHATVRTVLDGAIAIPVTDSLRRLAALVHGDGDHLIVDMIARSQQPKVGDILYSSGAGGLIPQGIPVARVTTITPMPGALFIKISAVPTALWQQHHWLAIAHLSVDTYSATP
ncbi:MAG: rod shape-determining protein MreC [Mariprofundales bacterium]